MENTKQNGVSEYIECTESVENYFIKGNIYRVIDSSMLHTTLVVCNIDTAEYTPGSELFVTLKLDGFEYYKPSTKEEYEAQLTNIITITPMKTQDKMTQALEKLNGLDLNLNDFLCITLWHVNDISLHAKCSSELFNDLESKGFDLDFDKGSKWFRGEKDGVRIVLSM
jgi:hypothetical protein